MLPLKLMRFENMTVGQMLPLRRKNKIKIKKYIFKWSGKNIEYLINEIL